MPSKLNKLKLDELRHIGEANGISDVMDLRREELIDQLRAIDEGLDGDDGESDAGVLYSLNPEAQESSEIRKLELQLQVEKERRERAAAEMEADRVRRERIDAEVEADRVRKERLDAEVAADREHLEIEKERAGLRSSRPADSFDVSVGIPRDIRGMLPSMQGEDVIGFFNAFERVLEMHDVERSVWSKLLAPHLSQKATRVYSRLSLEQCKCYATVKEHILMSYK
mgnify:CR=1 FL=1